MLLGGIGFVFNIVPLVFLMMNIGMGAAVSVMVISLTVLFRRMEKTAVIAEAV